MEYHKTLMCRTHQFAAVVWLALTASACAPDDTTGYTLNVTTDFVGSELPTQLVISCFVNDKVTVNEERYPTGRTPLAFKVGRVAEIGIDADSDLEGERRFWVRAVRSGNMAVLAEAAARAPTVQKGKRPVIEMPLTWGRLPDADGDGVPDEIDNCPQVANPEQGACVDDEPDAGSPIEPTPDAENEPIDAETPEPNLDATVF